MSETETLSDTELLDCLLLVQDPIVRRLFLHYRAENEELKRRLKVLETIVFVIKKTFSFISWKYAMILTTAGGLLAWLVK